MPLYFWGGVTPPGLSAAAGSGDVVGPASATDNAVARYDTASGKLLQGSSVLVDDSGRVSGGHFGLKAGSGGSTLGSVDAGKVVTIDIGGGADSVTLPAGPTIGFWFIAYIQGADELTLQAQGSHVIRTGAAASSAGGTMKSSTQGSSALLFYAASNQWAAIPSGTWTLA